jgi:hypothetical protein
MNKKLNITLLVLWTGLIAFAVLAPSNSLPKSIGFFSFIPHFDKLVHCGMFGGFAFLLFWLFPIKQYLIFSALKTFLISFAFAFITEILQLLLAEVIQRSFEWWDLFADVSGIVLAIGLCCIIARNKPNIKTRK